MPNFISQGPFFNSCYRQNLADDFAELLCTKPFIIIPSPSLHGPDHEKMSLWAYVDNEGTFAIR